jgi:hypothetical protein
MDRLERGAGAQARVDQRLPGGLDHFLEAPGLGQRHAFTPQVLDLGKVCARAGVEHRHPGDALGRLPHDLERQIAAHREPDVVKPGRRLGEDARRDRRHAVVAGVLRDRDRPQPPQLRYLRSIEPRRAIQAWNEKDRKTFGHWRLSLRRVLR